MESSGSALRVGKRLGKYRIQKRLAEGGFACVYRAYDTVSGIAVALKVPHASMLTREGLEGFRQEVRVSARLDHPNVLPIKDAGDIEGVFVIVYPLGTESLADRLTRRMSMRTVVSFMEQMLEGLAFAHRSKILHSDIKPDNFILFPDERLRLADFGIARIALRTISGSGSGTVEYIAPEQAMGKPSLRSDVFSLGMIFYRMLTGVRPEWPFQWPMLGYERLKRSAHDDVISFLKRALSVDSRGRFADADEMLRGFRKIRTRLLAAGSSRRKKTNGALGTSRDWRTVRRRDFLRKYRTALALRTNCRRCQGPVSEFMAYCPWCRSRLAKWWDTTRFPSQCPRCRRGIKSDWRFCPWCYGAAVNPEARPRYSDVRYEKQCRNKSCQGRMLMPFMRYCPWCRRKTDVRWTFAGADGKCPRCKWAVVHADWECCAWCGRTLRTKSPGGRRS